MKILPRPSRGVRIRWQPQTGRHHQCHAQRPYAALDFQQVCSVSIRTVEVNSAAKLDVKIAQQDYESDTWRTGEDMGAGSFEGVCSTPLLRDVQACATHAVA